MHQLQSGVGLECMPNPIHLNLASHHAQGGVGLARIPDPLCLNLAMRQVQGSIGLTRMSNLIHLDAISQVQGIWIWQYAKSKVVWVLHAC